MQSAHSPCLAISKYNYSNNKICWETLHMKTLRWHISYCNFYWKQFSNLVIFNLSKGQKDKTENSWKPILLPLPMSHVLLFTHKPWCWTACAVYRELYTYPNTNCSSHNTSILSKITTLTINPVTDYIHAMMHLSK